MRLFRKITFCAVAIGVFISPGPVVWADDDVQKELQEVKQTLEQLKQTIHEQNEVIERQQQRIHDLEYKVNANQQPAVPPQPASVSTPPPIIPRNAAPPGQIGAVLPEIGVVADIVATGSEKKSDDEGNNRVSAREVELVLGSYVDPYSRLDSTISFSDQGEAVALEEAYLTRWGLPWDAKGRFGRFFPRIGKAASLHRDSLDTVDEPLVVRRYFGEEGFKRAGIDFTRPIEGPAGLVFEPSVGVLEGGTDEGTIFGDTRRRPTVYSHLETFKDLSETSNLELGLTHLVGSKDADARFEVNVFGVDATYLHHITPFNKLKLQSELYLQDRKEAFSIDGATGVVTKFDKHPWGAYLLADYRFAPRWSIGARADHVRLVDTAASRHADDGLSAYLTFYQSEFARWRLQYEHTERANEKSEDAAYLQGTFAIGTHKHQIQ